MAVDRQLLHQGAEARIYAGSFMGRPAIIKERFVKTYRHESLDRMISQQRTKAEVRCMLRCRVNGIRTPVVYFVDLDSHIIYMEHIQPAITVREHIQHIQNQQLGDADLTETLSPLARKIGTTLGSLHQAGIVHGDLTTSNMMLLQPQNDNRAEGDSTLHDTAELILLDFGLGQGDVTPEDKGVDMYVLERAFLSTHPNTETFFQLLLKSYIDSSGTEAKEVMRKFEEIRLRGRKRTMVG